MSNSEAVSARKITQAMDGVNGLGLFCIQQYSDIVGRFQSNVEFVTDIYLLWQATLSLIVMVTMMLLMMKVMARYPCLTYRSTLASYFQSLLTPRSYSLITFFPPLSLSAYSYILLHYSKLLLVRRPTWTGGSMILG